MAIALLVALAAAAPLAAQPSLGLHAGVMEGPLHDGAAVGADVELRHRRVAANFAFDWADALSVRHVDGRYFFDPLPFWIGLGAAAVELPGGSGTASAPIVSAGYLPRRFGGRIYVSARVTRFTTHASHADPVRATVAFLSVGARLLR